MPARLVLHRYACAALALALCPANGLGAQDVPQGREVVQALPSPASEELKQALNLLARNSRNLEALISAGTASLELGDVDAAVGFFGRADELAPGDPRVKAGKAAAYVRTRRPVEALRLFREAEAGGVEIVRLAPDYGLAFDLVGNNRQAQEAYRRALARGADDEVTRRLALSQAIAGDDRGFEQTLRPLLSRRDFAAYRVRAFGLAILGKADDAVAIAEAVMPAAMARQMEPYLRFMPQLTKAQQAAAANLGIFPRAAQIGRDDPRIAALSGRDSDTTPSRTADAGLAPAGAPLGTQSSAPAAATRPAVSQETVSRAEARRLAREARREAASDPLSRSRERPRVVQVKPEEAQKSAPSSAPEPAAMAGDMVSGASDSGETVALVRRAPEETGSPSASQAEPIATLASRAADTPTEPGFDLANVDGSTDSTATSPAEAAPIAEAVDEPASVSDAFADFAAPVAAPTRPARGAVDISAIEAPRETAPAPETEPAEPEHPSRFWVQVATGRDRSALRFDWRRLSRQTDGLLADKGPFVTAWGQTNRLLAGPFPSRQAARNALNQLQEKGVDAFTFTSPEGQEIEQLR